MNDEVENSRNKKVIVHLEVATSIFTIVISPAFFKTIHQPVTIDSHGVCVRELRGFEIGSPSGEFSKNLLLKMR